MDLSEPLRSNAPPPVVPGATVTSAGSFTLPSTSNVPMRSPASVVSSTMR